MTEERSSPSLFTFNPFHIPFHTQAIYDLDNFDYSQGVFEQLYSGSVGSGKSLLAAHNVCKHLLRFPRAKVIMGRRSLPDLKKTIFSTILEHLECEELKEGKDYFYRETTAEIWFRNKSELVPYTWADKKFKRVRSINASAAWFEELTENDEEDKTAYFEAKARIGRIPHIAQQERFIIACTNPDSPAHWAYRYFIETPSETRKVYYSLTEKNPFLDPAYVRQLKMDLDPKEARRLLYGEWVDVNSERIYYAYDSDKQYLRNTKYKIDPRLPINISFDFNIGEGKPMSSVALQYDPFKDIFHVFDEVVVHGFRTADVMDEWEAKGYLDGRYEIRVNGDASGEARDTRSVLNDYEIIKKYLANLNLRFKMEVPRSNPPIRTRHNRVNAYCRNDLGQCRLFVYQGAPTVDEALRLTSLKKGADFTREDDSKAFQHIGTAVGYSVMFETNRIRTKVQSLTR